jgi:hypothetical protein
MRASGVRTPERAIGTGLKRATKHGDDGGAIGTGLMRALGMRSP